jgi:hypothetical protein
VNEFQPSAGLNGTSLRDYYMAKSFAITTIAIDTLKVDDKGHAEAVFTITNATARPVRGMARAKALSDTKREWLSIAGETERDFGGGATEQFTLNFDAPGASAGKYPFRLDVASALNPDEDFTEGPTVNVEVAAAAATPAAKKPFPKWIIFVIIGVVILLIAGVILFLALRSRGTDIHEAETATPTPVETATATPVATPSLTPTPASTYEGAWVNADPNTNGITRLNIQQRGTEVKVHAWGKCHPTDCDWGNEDGAMIGRNAQVTWDQGFAIKKMVLSLVGERRLKVVLDTVFNDTRPRQHAEYEFVRQN